MHEEDFDNVTVDVCTAEEPTVGVCWKPSSHSPSELGANTEHILSSCTQPTIEIDSLCDEIEFLSFSMSKRCTRAGQLGLCLQLEKVFECVARAQSKGVLTRHANSLPPRNTLNTVHFHFYTTHLFECLRSGLTSVVSVLTICDSHVADSLAQGKDMLHMVAEPGHSRHRDGCHARTVHAGDATAASSKQRSRNCYSSNSGSNRVHHRRSSQPVKDHG